MIQSQHRGGGLSTQYNFRSARKHSYAISWMKLFVTDGPRARLFTKFSKYKRSILEKYDSIWIDNDDDCTPPCMVARRIGRQSPPLAPSRNLRDYRIFCLVFFPRSKSKKRVRVILTALENPRSWIPSQTSPRGPPYFFQIASNANLLQTGKGRFYFPCWVPRLL